MYYALAYTVPIVYQGYQLVTYGQPIINALHTIKYFTDFGTFVYTKCTKDNQEIVIFEENTESDFIVITKQ